MFNEEFNENVPMYYLDSGVVIALSLIKLLEDLKFKESEIKLALIRGSRDTVNGGEAIEGNPHNIDMPTAEILYELYTKNKKGEVALCIPPTVYKETMLDGLAHDNTKRQYTRKFVRENCFLVFPLEDIASFARKTVELQNKLKTVKSGNGEFGLCPDFQKRKKGGNVRILVDVNFEDRLILSQIAVIVKQGKSKAQIISLSNTDEELNNEKVVKLYDESQRVEREGISSLKPDKGHGETAKFIQINSKDFGKRLTKSKKDPDSTGKNSVAEQIAKILDDYFGDDGELKVQTPNELENE